MPYTAPTLAQAQAALAARLSDSGFTFWSAAELTVYLQEALRTWSCWTSHWRGRAAFPCVQNQPFYDLQTVLASLRPMTVTNHDMVQAIEYALLEPPTPTQWTGTAQFTLAQVSEAIAGRRDAFRQQTGMVVSYAETAVAVPDASGRIDLDETVLSVRRAAWRVTATGVLQPLRLTDEWSLNAYSRTWPTSTQPPSMYSVTATPPITIQVAPPPAGAGTLALVSVDRGDPFTVPATSGLLGIPDDWAWVVKYGALADLLQRDGLALDPERAAYCQQRWEQGIALARVAPVILDARIDGNVVRVGTLAAADAYNPLWQLLMGVPREVATAGQTLLATIPVANGNQTVTLDVVRCAPVPTAAGDVLQVGADIYDSVLDIAQHVALFKQGAAQLRGGLQLLERAASAANVDLGLQQAQQPARAPALAQNRTDAYQQPRELPPVEVE